MSALTLRVARRLIDLWACLYTLGLPSVHRLNRLELIRADVFDEVADGLAEGVPAGDLAASLLGRFVRGMPEDVTWRLFEARRLPGDLPIIILERTPIMATRTLGPAFFAIAAGLTWTAVLVLALEAPAYSLAYGGALLSLVALAGWALEARRPSSEEAVRSPWPLLLSLGIVALAGGLVFAGGRLGLLVAGPLALGLTVALGRSYLTSRSASLDANASEVTPLELARHATRGEAIALETPPHRGVTRRTVLRGSFGIGFATLLASMGGIVVDFLWQRNVAGFGGIVVTAGKASAFPAGSKTIVREGKFWLVNLTEAQGGPGFLALWQKCPHLGCVVPWNDSFTHIDPETGLDKQGWFRCPCHQSTYTDAGVRVYGPAPRSMDRMALRITEEGFIEVNTGDISKGTDDNAAFAVAPESEAPTAHRD